MKLAQRLLLGAVLIVTAFMIVAVVMSGDRLRVSLRRLATSQLAREARLVSSQWSRATDPDAFADSAGAALGHRDTLVDSAGRVLGDSEFSDAALGGLQNHNDRPEIAEARRNGEGSAERMSPSEGDEELYVAVRARDNAIARVSVGTTQLDAIVARARRDVVVSGLVALVIAMALAAVFSRQISKPVTELRDVASAIAAGDLTRRPALAAPGEVGDLAFAVRRMAELLESRMRALEAEDEFQGAVVEALNEGVVGVDRQRRVVRINRSARVLLGVAAEVPFSIDLLPRDRSLQEAIGEALDGHGVERVETHVGSRTISVTARPLGERGAVVALFDLTSVRRLETVRRDFVANVSHELKTPLTAIRGFAETLSTELAGDAHHAQFAETIRTNAERMQRLIDDLLDLSRIESGGWVPTPQAVDLAAAANEAINPYRAEAEARGTRLETDIAGNAASFRADPVAVRQVLGNLIENAVRYTPQGGTVTVFARADDGGIAIGVRDTGAGIPSDHLPRIFERFYRVDTARSRAAGGTGLGLAIVKHLVEAHGGHVRAESQVGHGTTVTALFPMT